VHTRRRYRELFSQTWHFTTTTRRDLERAISRALLGYKDATLPLRAAVRAATHELQAQEFDVAATLALLGPIVEDAGRACGADRPSLLSREPLWMPVRTQVLECARSEFSKFTSEKGGDLVTPAPRSHTVRTAAVDLTARCHRRAG
jgi:hypothetical protein